MNGYDSLPGVVGKVGFFGHSPNGIQNGRAFPLWLWGSRWNGARQRPIANAAP